VLITGESGTGKELIARAIHFGSPRREGPFVPVNCSALPGELAESLSWGRKREILQRAVNDHAAMLSRSRRDRMRIMLKAIEE